MERLLFFGRLRTLEHRFNQIFSYNLLRSGLNKGFKIAGIRLRAHEKSANRTRKNNCPGGVSNGFPALSGELKGRQRVPEEGRGLPVLARGGRASEEERRFPALARGGGRLPKRGGFRFC